MQRRRCGFNRLRREDDARYSVGVAGEAEFIVDLRKCAEFEAGDVGEDRSATNRDSVFDQKFSQIAEEVVHLTGGFKVERVGAEMTGQVGVEVSLQLALNVTDAEARVWQDGKAAAPAGIEDVAAIGSRQEGAGLRFHMVLNGGVPR
jgi:hypothetical protein